MTRPNPRPVQKPKHAKRGRVPAPFQIPVGRRRAAWQALSRHDVQPRRTCACLCECVTSTNTWARTLVALSTYRAKRNFRRTPEPRGRAAPRARRRGRFVVQKHAARQLHYDFRLELDGVLVSWAVPKGPSMDPADKRLAMHVEDHPIEYGAFEGVIPAGEYGGGSVMVWDRGTWTPEGDAAAGYTSGHLKFSLNGEKLKGGFVLVRTRGSRYGGKPGKEAWLLIKETDAYARPGKSIVDAAPVSVVSGRGMDEIARAEDRVCHSNKSAKANVRSGAVAPSTTRAAASTSVRATKSTRKAHLPERMAPMLATLVDEAPTGDDWYHEIKYDGYRMMCRIAGGKARLYSRNGNDWTDRFTAVTRDLAKLPVSEAWIDGEVVVVDHRGRTSFQSLQNALASPTARGIALFVFDVLFLDGRDLRDLPLEDRKRVLHDAVGDGLGTVRPSPDVRGNGREFIRQACALGLEGCVSKRADSRYLPGVRTRGWVKVKCVQRQEMVIGGYTDPRGTRTGFGALLLGYYADGALRYAGKVGTGFDVKLLATLAPQLERRERASPPFVDPPRGFEAKGAHWVRPDLVAEIAFTEWSRDGALRHPSFEGLRLDKKARDVVREAPAQAPDADAPSKPRPVRKGQ
ncbi:MAG: non-homologous end-joining DNA ligase [Casimicrobiaceae bacterium]